MTSTTTTPTAARTEEVSEYDVARSLDSQYSSHQVPGGITPQYSNPIAHTTLIANTAARLQSTSYAESLRQARIRAEIRHKRAKDRKYLSLAIARWTRLKETPPIARIDGSTHRCVASCEGIESTVEPDLWVCVASGNIHHCGDKCNFYMTESNAGRVLEYCPLSGIVGSAPHIVDDAADDEAKFSGRYTIERSLNPSFRSAMGMEDLLSSAAFADPQPVKKHPLHVNPMIDALAKNAMAAAKTPAQQREAMQKRTLLENASLTNAARNVMHRLIFSEKRRALDELIMARAYDKLAQEFAKHYETRRKSDLPPDCDYLVNRVIDTSDTLKLRGGNVRYGQTLGAIETQLLLGRLARLSVTLWRAFQRHNAWSIGKYEPHRHPTIEYHTLAVLYASKDGVEMPLTKSRWLARVPELQHLLPNEKDFGQLGFKKAEFSKNETFFRGALSNFFSREHVTM